MNDHDQNGEGNAVVPDASRRATLDARPARREELRHIASALRETIADHPSYSPAHRAYEMSRMGAAHLESLWRSAPHNVMVGTVDGAFAAFAITEPDNGIGWMRWGVALPPYRRFGIAAFVFGAMIDHFRSRGLNKLCAVTRIDNRPVIALLKQKRFAVACEMRQHWFGEDFLYWERLLHPVQPMTEATRPLPIARRVLIHARHAVLDRWQSVAGPRPLSGGLAPQQQSGDEAKIARPQRDVTAGQPPCRQPLRR